MSVPATQVFPSRSPLSVTDTDECPVWLSTSSTKSAPDAGHATGVGSEITAVRSAAATAPSLFRSHELAAAPAGEVEQVVPVALEEGAALPAEEVDISGWDLDSELAGMTDQEKETFLNKMHQRAKDGSCLEKYSLCSWG